MREKQITQEKIRHLALDPPLVVKSGISCAEVLSQMRQQRQSCALVCKEDRCVGIFTERDYLYKLIGRKTEFSRPVDEFMTPNPRTLTPDDTVGEAIEMMSEYGFRNIPLVDVNGNSVGLLRIRNIIDFLAELYPDVVLNVPPRFKQRFGAPDGA